MHFEALIVITTAWGLASGSVLATQYACLRARLPFSRQLRFTLCVAAGMAVWLALTALLAANGFLSDFSPMPPPLLVLIFISFLGTLLLAFSSLGKLWAALPLPLLIAFQAFRCLAEWLLHLGYQHGFVPIQMTWEGWNFDILTGVTALPVAWYLRRYPSRRVTLVWNALGLVLLINIIIISMASTPTALRLFTQAPANTFVSQFPYVWLPTVLVQFALLGHLLCFQNLAFAGSKKPMNDDLKKRLTPEQYSVTQQEATEPPYKNAYWNQFQDGIYVDVVTGEALFSSQDKYDAGCGWPSFSKPLQSAKILEKKDTKLGMSRTEVRSSKSHLGHVFNDGPGPTGLRYCINSASLRFIAAADLKKEGYGEYAPLFEKKGNTLETATLAGGCFWGMEEILRKVKGIKGTRVGYTGGFTENPTYEVVKKGASGHAEAIEIRFDPKVISFEEVLGYFFRMHDPTTKNRQGNDIGSQYRSAIFTHSDEQKKIAEKVKAATQKSGKWKADIVTEIVPAREFYSAEDYHQDYLQKNPGGYTCHYLREDDALVRR